MKGCDAAVVRSLERELRASLPAWGMPEPCITTIVPLAEQIETEVAAVETSESLV
jgi:hypothetical protein